MSIPSDPDSLITLRALSAAFPQPVDESAVERLRQNVRQHNPFISQFICRSDDRDYDVIHHVFRFDTRNFSEIFEYGFQAWPPGDTPSDTYFSLEHHVNEAGNPLDPNRSVPHAFVSTTLSSGWEPTPSIQTLPERGQIQVYRYEIYAPGGILVSHTLGNRYRHPSQHEISFVRGIAPQYIRSAQLFTGTRQQQDPRYVDWQREPRIRLNGHFNTGSEFCIQLPVHYRMEEMVDDGRRRRVPLNLMFWRVQLPDDDRRERRNASNFFVEASAPDSTSVGLFTTNIVDRGGYINAAFRSSRRNEAYLFMRNEYVLVNYAPRTADDRILNGPLLICDGFPALGDTAFGEYGIDCAFDCHGGNEAFIFSGNLCARIDYAPGTTNCIILNGPMTITAMFPFFNDTVFANSIDAAFTSSATHEAYLFKGDSYANINYYSKTCIAIRKITQGFYSLRNTIFESGVEAAFASHRSEEAYIFKEDQYALINFARGTTDHYIIGGGVKPITSNWPSLGGILPRENLGVDYHDHHNQEQDQQEQDHQVHDEL